MTEAVGQRGDTPAETSPAAHCAWPPCDDARRYNRWASAIVICTMIGLGVALGAAAAVAIASGNGEAPTPESAVPPALQGAAIGLTLATLAALWGWFGGAAAIIRMHGARPITQPDDPELYDTVAGVARLAGLPMPRVLLIEDSALNACSTGRDPARACLLVTTGLRRGLTPDELRAVVAHEVAHIRRLDTRFALVMASMVGLIALACGWLWRLAFQSARATKRSTDTIKAWGWVSIALFALAGLLTVAAFAVGAFLQFCIRREREYRADAHAAELTGDPASLAGALKKCSADADPLVDVANRATAHLFFVNPLRRMRESGQSIDSPFCSHPPVAKRIARLEELAAARRLSGSVASSV